MKIFILKENNISSVAFAVANELADNRIMIYPTETIHGLGSAYNNTKGIYKIDEIKNRKQGKPHIVLIKYEWIADYINDPDRYLPLLQIFWPGPFTFILPSKKISPFSTGHHVAFRVSAHPFIELLLNFLKQPITSTSANINGQEPLNGFIELTSAFSSKVDLIVHDPKFENTTPSALIDATDFPEKITILREGSSNLDKIKNIFPDLTVSKREL